MKKNVPAVSIIIPMYNVEKYIGECLDSILNQTFDDYEVIAVDDCSKDKTCEVVESYLPKFNGGGWRNSALSGLKKIPAARLVLVMSGSTFLSEIIFYSLTAMTL